MKAIFNMARTILTIAEQHKFLSDNWQYTTLEHRWSNRGSNGGVSRILDRNGNVLGKASGCGYDRYGSALGNAIIELFPDLIHRLAKKTCKSGSRNTYLQGPNYYGLFYNRKTKKAWLDGGCGDSCMIAILNKIGFTLVRVGQTEQSYNGTVFYTLAPITKHERKRVK